MAAVTRTRLQPWAGVIGAGAGWFLSQQAGAQTAFAECTAGRWWSVALLGVLGLALDLGGALLSWQVWRKGEPGSGGRGFVGLLGILVPAVLAFPILMQTVAGLLVPGCGS